MKKTIALCCIAFSTVFTTGMSKPIQPEIDFSFNDESVILYQVGNNDITIEVEKSKVENYTNIWEWSVEPTILMYAADGNTSWIMQSEVEQYKTVGWSLNPPITLYGRGKNISVLVEEKQDYLDTGVWFETYEEANPAVFTYNVFTKSNLSVAQLNKMLSKTGLAGCGQSFYNIEQQYNVNALFAVAVACHESGNGYHKANTNNFFGLRGNKGWMSFSSPDACINYFGQLMNKKIYLNKSIEGIGMVYCGSGWAPKVKAHMKDKWNNL